MSAAAAPMQAPALAISLGDFLDPSFLVGVGVLARLQQSIGAGHLAEGHRLPVGRWYRLLHLGLVADLTHEQPRDCFRAQPEALERGPTAPERRSLSTTALTPGTGHPRLPHKGTLAGDVTGT